MADRKRIHGKEGQRVPEMTPEFIESVSERYIELYEHITGHKFHKADETDLADRIKTNVEACLISIRKDF